MKTKRIKYKLQLFKNINSQNYMINQRDLYKKVAFTNDTMEFVNTVVYTGSYLNTSKYPFSKIPYDTAIYPASDLLDPHIYWNYVNHNFYKTNIDEQNYNNAQYLDTDIKRNLYDHVTVLNISQELYKSRIKPGTVSILDNSSKEQIKFVDDSNCNILVQNSATIVPSENLILDINFNEKYKDRIGQSNSTILNQDFSIYKNHGTPLPYLKYADGILTSGILQEPIGTQANFNGSSSILIDHIPVYKFKENDYAISFWITPEMVETDSEFQYIVSKQQLTNLEVKERESGLITYKYKKILTGNYPFSIRLISSGSDFGHLYFSRLGGDTEVYVKSNIPLNNNQYHVVCQKIGSKLQIYINGVKNAEINKSVTGKTDNTSPIYLGSLINENMFYTGKLDEFKIYNRSLTIDEIKSLADNDYDTCYALQTNQVGNVFYKHGDIVISTINPKYKKIFLGHNSNMSYTSESLNTGFSVEFRREHTLYEHEIVCKIPASQFNFSTNPTLKINNDTDTEKFKPFVSDSNFKLYFTTIGLYNDNYELLAIAKLSSPLPKYEDKDMNIIVKFDVD